MRITIPALIFTVTAIIWGCGGEDPSTANNNYTSPPDNIPKTLSPTNVGPPENGVSVSPLATADSPKQRGKEDNAANRVNESSSVVTTASSPDNIAESAEINTGGMGQQDAAANYPSLALGGIDQAGGVITGMIRFAGEQKPQRKLNMSADRYCACAHKNKPPLQQTYVFGKNNTLQNVLVYISKGMEGQHFAPPARGAVLDQRGCAYTPHVIGVVVNQTLEIRNSDQTMHNVKFISKMNGKGNNAMPGGEMVLTRTFSRPELKARYRCDVHPWMEAILHVMAHPFFAVTQADGTFMIRGVPPGNYEISVLHEFDVFQPDKNTVPVMVADGKTVTLTITYSYRPKQK